MEIREYWNSMGRRRRALVVAPLAAAVAAAAVGLARPREYTAVTTVRVPVLARDLATPLGVRQVVAEFAAVVESAAFAERFRQDAGVSSGELRDRLRLSQVGSGAVVEVRYRGSGRAAARRGSASAGRLALDTYLSPVVAESEQYLAAAQQELDRAAAALGEFLAASPIPDPATTFEARQGVIADLRLRQAIADADGDRATAAALAAAIEQTQQELAATAGPAREHRAMLAVYDRAEAVVSTAHERAIEARARRALADDDGVVATGRATALPWRSSVAQLVVGAAVLAALVTAMILVVAEIAARRISRVADEPTDASEPERDVTQGDSPRVGWDAGAEGGSHSPWPQPHTSPERSPTP